MIFISYSWQYKEKTKELVDLLKQNGEEIWVDNERLDLSLPLEGQIEKAIKECDSFIQLYSKSIPITDWMDFEYEVAKNVICPKKIQLIEFESQCLTKAICNAGSVLNRKSVETKQNCCKFDN